MHGNEKQKLQDKGYFYGRRGNLGWEGLHKVCICISNVFFFPGWNMNTGFHHIFLNFV